MLCLFTASKHMRRTKQKSSLKSAATTALLCQNWQILLEEAGLMSPIRRLQDWQYPIPLIDEYFCPSGVQSSNQSVQENLLNSSAGYLSSHHALTVKIRTSCQVERENNWSHTPAVCSHVLLSRLIKKIIIPTPRHTGASSPISD